MIDVFMLAVTVLLFASAICGTALLAALTLRLVSLSAYTSTGVMACVSSVGLTCFRVLCPNPFHPTRWVDAVFLAVPVLSVCIAALETAMSTFRKRG